VAALVVLMATFAPPAAGRFGRVPQIDLLRLEGRLGPPRADDKGTTDLELQHGKDELHFQLAELRVLSGGRLPGSVLSAVSPYHPNFFLHGPEELMRKLRAAGADETVRIMGYNRRGTRDLMVTEVEVTPPATPATAQ
jgi:hypothetical protein